MKTIQNKIDALEKKLKEKKETDDANDYDRAKREVKEEAGKSEVNVDNLHEKLIHLESVARKINHESKEKITLVLKRFHIHKRQHPSFVGHLVLKLISSKEEESVLEKEQKMFKHFSMSYQGGASSSPSAWGMGSAPYPQFPGSTPFWPQGPAYMHSQQRFTPPFRPRFRQAPPSRQICFKCNKPGHYVKNCPLNQM